MSNESRKTVGLLVRAILVVALAIILVGGMRWAMGVTNANTHLISSNLNGMQNQFDRKAASAAEEVAGSAAEKVKDVSDAKVVPGPSIDPVADAPKH